MGKPRPHKSDCAAKGVYVLTYFRSSQFFFDGKYYYTVVCTRYEEQPRVAGVR